MHAVQALMFIPYIRLPFFLIDWGMKKTKINILEEKKWNLHHFLWDTGEEAYHITTHYTIKSYGFVLWA